MSDDRPRVAELRDGQWVEAVPEPLWIGWRLRIAQCECGQQFKRKRGQRRVLDDREAREQYRDHWRRHHSAASR